MGKKVKVVLDANVWLSLFMGKSVTKEFSHLLERLEVYVTKEMLEEISRVLAYPKIEGLFELSGVNTREVLERIVENSELIKPKVKVKVIKEDPEDNKVLDCALQAKADWIVTGDKHLLGIKRFRNVRILSPRRFLDEMNRA